MARVDSDVRAFEIRGNWRYTLLVVYTRRMREAEIIVTEEAGGGGLSWRPTVKKRVFRL